MRYKCVCVCVCMCIYIYIYNIYVIFNSTIAKSELFIDQETKAERY